jgi:hypothetical protein
MGVLVEVKAEIEVSERVLRICFSAVMLSRGVDIEISLLDRIPSPIGRKPSFAGNNITDLIAGLDMIFEVKSSLAA